MKKELIHSLTDTFEGHAQETEKGVEFWLARDLQHLLGYAEYTAVLRAVLACAHEKITIFKGAPISITSRKRAKPCRS